MSEMTNRYIPKINSIFKRDSRGRFTDEYARTEFAQLAAVPWRWTYKWDGTSAGINFRSDDIETSFGKTANTVITEDMYRAMGDWAREKAVHLRRSGVTVYGELVGPKIQSNRHGLDAVQFKPFAARDADGVWWGSWRVHEEIPDAPRPRRALLSEVAAISSGAALTEACNGLAPDGQTYVEGLVGTPDLCDLDGERIWTKIKVRDLA